MRFVLRPRGEVASTPAPAPAAGPAFGPSFELHVSLVLLTGLGVTIIWLATGGCFWPVWVWFGLAVTVSLHAVAVRAWAARGDRDRAFRVKVEFCALIAGYQWVIWALAGFGYVWPIWPMLGMGTALALRALGALRRPPAVGRTGAELVQRVDVLTRTRQGALDVKAAERRRIERDLHDGAQARLVALTMHLGRAEERLSDRPEIADAPPPRP